MKEKEERGEGKKGEREKRRAGGREVEVRRDEGKRGKEGGKKGREGEKEGAREAVYAYEHK